MIYTTLKLEELIMNETINYRIEKLDKILAENGELKDFDTNNEEDNQ